MFVAGRLPTRRKGGGMAEYGLERTFGIDNGELDGLTPQTIFVLGYELSRVDDLLKSGASGTILIHADNRVRIDDYADKLGRKVRFVWMKADVSESWLNLIIEPKEPT